MKKECKIIFTGKSIASLREAKTVSCKDAKSQSQNIFTGKFLVFLRDKMSNELFFADKRIRAVVETVSSLKVDLNRDGQVQLTLQGMDPDTGRGTGADYKVIKTKRRTGKRAGGFIMITESDLYNYLLSDKGSSSG